MDVAKEDVSYIILDSLKFKRVETVSTDDYENMMDYSIQFKSLRNHCEDSDRLFEKIKSSIEKVINEYKNK